MTGSTAVAKRIFPTFSVPRAFFHFLIIFFIFLHIIHYSCSFPFSVSFFFSSLGCISATFPLPPPPLLLGRGLHRNRPVLTYCLIRRYPIGYRRIANATDFDFPFTYFRRGIDPGWKGDPRMQLRRSMKPARPEKGRESFRNESRLTRHHRQSLH